VAAAVAAALDAERHSRAAADEDAARKARPRAPDLQTTKHAPCASSPQVSTLQPDLWILYSERRTL